MSKKRITTLVISIISIAALAIGSTLAYFTSQDEARNTFVMGNIAIDLQESEDGQNWTDEGLDYTSVMPGDTLNKYAQVVVDENSEDCYVRIKMDIDLNEITNEDDKAAIEDAIKAAAIANDFIAGTNGYYYYNGTASANDVLTFLTEITIPTSVGNDSQDLGFSIDLTADAIQAANITLGDTAVGFFSNYVNPAV